MKRLSMMAVTGVMTFMMSACGENAPQPPATKPDAMMPAQQMQQPGQPQSNGDVAQPMPANTQAPTEEQMSGATAQE